MTIVTAGSATAMPGDVSVTSASTLIKIDRTCFICEPSFVRTVTPVRVLCVLGPGFRRNPVTVRAPLAPSVVASEY